MDNYVKPQMQIFQEYAAVNTEEVSPLHACVIGSKYGVHRYEEEDKALLGNYVKDVATTYDWPDKQTNSSVVLDPEDIEVTVEDALIQYYTGSTFAVPTGAAAGGTILESSLVLQSANGSSRASVFGSRDVQVGDKVKVNWDTETIDTFITNIVGELGSVVDASVKGPGNQVATSAVAASVDSDTVVDSDLSFAATGTYDNLVDGIVSETYVCTVITAGGDGVAELSIASASGKDDVSSIVVDYSTMAIGTKGVILDITDAGTGVFEVGETLTISAQQEYVIPTTTSGGSYAGNKETGYIVMFTEGGVIGTDTPKYKVLTNNGVDSQPESAVLAGAVVVGNYGVTVTFTDSQQICKGDVITILATPQAERAKKTIYLADALVSNSNECSDADSITISLLIEDTVKLPFNSYVASEENIILYSNATVEDIYTGIGTPLNIIAGTVYVDYLERLTGPTEVQTFSDISYIEDILGPVIPKNELAYGVYKALLNSNGTTVYAVSVATESVSGYDDALDALTHEPVVYSIVPLTKDVEIIARVKDWVLQESTPLKINWKKGFFCSPVNDQALVVEDAQATITDPLSGENYNLVTVTGGTLITSGVKAGDTLRYNYRPELGATVYDERTIASVVSETALTLTTSAMDAPVDFKVEVYATMTKRGHATAIGNQSATYNSRRIHNIWPDVIKSDSGVTVPGYFLCAAIAGLTSAIAPHQPISNVEVLGFSEALRSKMFNEDDLDVIASKGTWVITTDDLGVVHSRHQLSTDMSRLESRESSITNNWDSISREVKASYSDLVGKSNVSDELLELISFRITLISVAIEKRKYSELIGPQIQGYKIISLEKDTVLLDKIKLVYKPILPRPLNSLDITIYI